MCKDVPPRPQRGRDVTANQTGCCHHSIAGGVCPNHVGKWYTNTGHIQPPQTTQLLLQCCLSVCSACAATSVSLSWPTQPEGYRPDRSTAGARLNSLLTRSPDMPFHMSDSCSSQLATQSTASTQGKKVVQAVTCTCQHYHYAAHVRSQSKLQAQPKAQGHQLVFETTLWKIAYLRRHNV